MSSGLFIVTWGGVRIDRSMVESRVVKYRCKLERAHNEEPFNNAFDLNRNVMKIITSLARPGDAPINGRSTTHSTPLALFTLCASLHPFRASPPPLLVSYLARYRPLSLTRPRSADEFIGRGSRAEWSCIWPTTLCSKGKRGKWSVHRWSPMRRSFLLYCRLPPRPRSLYFVSPFGHLFVAWNFLEGRAGYSINIEAVRKLWSSSSSFFSSRFNHNCNNWIEDSSLASFVLPLK